MKSIIKKLKREGVCKLAKSAKINVFWNLEKQILYHTPKLLPLAFNKPRFLYLELTNNCNLNCKMCFRGGGRFIGYMQKRLFTKLIDEAADIGGVSLSFHFAGEATLHPNFTEYITYALKKKNRFYKLSLTTNGTLFNEEKAKLALGLDWVTFSIDGVGHVTENIRLGSNYETVKKNLEIFLRLRGGKTTPIISTNTVISTQTKNQLDQMQKSWKHKGVNVNYSGCITDTFKLIENPLAHEYSPHWFKAHENPVCYMPWANLLVTWNGEAHYCCHNLRGHYPIGNVNEESLMEVWHGKNLREVRMAILKNKPLKNSICYQCEKYRWNSQDGD